MAAQIIDGKEIAAQIRAEIKLSVDRFRESHSRVPGLAVILWNNNPASRLYVENKIKACEDTGMFSQVFEFSENAEVNELIDRIKALNTDDRIHGILVQLPVSQKEYETQLLYTISPAKDVDGLHPLNAGNLLLGNKAFQPCTPQGIVTILDYADVKIEGQHAVIVGRSNIVGKPVALMLLQRNATVTICHSRTNDLSEYTRKADILIAAVGKSQFITGDMVKSGATVVDVGINRVGKKVVGDVDFESVRHIAGKITPVPGGVGPLTIAMLLKNTYMSALEIANHNDLKMK